MKKPNVEFRQPFDPFFILHGSRFCLEGIAFLDQGMGSRPTTLVPHGPIVQPVLAGRVAPKRVESGPHAKKDAIPITIDPGASPS